MIGKWWAKWLHIQQSFGLELSGALAETATVAYEEGYVGASACGGYDDCWFLRASDE